MTKDKIDSFLKEIGLIELSPEELVDLKAKLVKSIHIGLERKGPSTQEDGGLLAIRTGFEPIKPEQWIKVPKGVSVISCAYGGNNWVSSIVEKGDDDNPKVIEEKRITVAEERRKMSFRQMVRMMGGQIKGLESEYSDERIVAISLGFPQLNSLVSYGVDAQFNRKRPAKNWEIIDYNEDLDTKKQPFIGKELLRHLKDIGFSKLDYVYIINDTNSVSNFIFSKEFSDEYESLSVGFVLGTGDNAAIGEFNLESGKARILEPDKITRRMAEKGLIPAKPDSLSNDCVYEFWTGGDYIRYRLACILELLGEEDFIINSSNMVRGIIDSRDKELVSRIANSDITIEEFEKEFNTDSGDYDLVKEIAKSVLKQASQVIGVLIASVVKSAGYIEGRTYIPIEGSVYWKGYKVKDVVKDTLEILIPKNKLVSVEAKGYVGIAQFAMVMANEKGIFGYMRDS